MFASKLLIAAAVLCVLLSLFSDGLVSAALNLCAFTLLIIYTQTASRDRSQQDDK